MFIGQIACLPEAGKKIRTMVKQLQTIVYTWFNQALGKVYCALTHKCIESSCAGGIPGGGGCI